MKTNTVRQCGEFIGFIGGGFGLLLIGFVSDRYVAYGCMIGTQLLLGAVQVALPCAYTDVAPSFSSSFNSLGNTMGALAGLCGPMIVGYLTTRWPENNGIWGWRIVFMMTAAMCCASLGLWYAFQTSEIVPELNTPPPPSLSLLLPRKQRKK